MEAGTIALELVKLIPSVLWFCLVTILIVMFYRPIRDDLLPRLSGFNVMGVEFSFVQESLDAALELAEKNPQWKVDVSREQKERALNRARHHWKLFRGARILWVDDHPENNINERRMFAQLGAHIDMARSTDEALGQLRAGVYDLAISDMARGDNVVAGLDFLAQFRKENKTTPMIFYVGVLDSEKGVPAQAFGITNRPDELLHLTLDTLERKKGC